ncbi:MAG: thiolase domain-containing protein [Anaerolineales bacterium]
MTDIIIAGIGQTEVGEHWDKSLRQLGAEAIRAALADSGGLRPQALFVGNMFAPILSRQAHLGALSTDFADLTGIEAVTVEAAGASGAAALRQGFLAVKSGLVDAALVLGVEKFTDQVGSGVESALATTLDSDYEAVPGLTPTAQAALLMRRYQAEYAVPADGLAGFALTAHAHGAGNPRAMFQKAIKTETYAKAEMVSEPLNLFDIAPNADGAAAILLTRRDLLPKNYPHPLIRLAGAGVASDMLALHDRRDPLWFEAAHLSAARALEQAGASLDAVDFFEYHDAFSIYAALTLEACGFASRGTGWKLAAEGALGLKGRFPCATMGGLKARGFPGGASGVYQAVEAALQLRGQAGKNQMERAQIGMIQSLGGPASTAVTHLLERMEV